MTDYRENLHTPPAAGAGSELYVACVVAARYRGKAPSVSELRDHFGMSRATAYRWRAAMVAAWGEPREAA